MGTKATGMSPSPQQHGQAPVQLTSRELWAQPCPQGAQIRVQATAGSEPLTFLHLLAGRGSSSVSDEVEEPGSLSASARKQALGKGEAAESSPWQSDWPTWLVGSGASLPALLPNSPSTRPHAMPFPKRSVPWPGDGYEMGTGQGTQELPPAARPHGQAEPRGRMVSRTRQTFSYENRHILYSYKAKARRWVRMRRSDLDRDTPRCNRHLGTSPRAPAARGPFTCITRAMLGRPQWTVEEQVGHLRPL